MTDAAKHLALGLAGEERVSRCLEDKGWRILARNWRPEGADRGLELDIVAEHADCLVFVEVKTRRVSRRDPEPRRNAGPQLAPDDRERRRPLRVPTHAALTPAKQGKLARAAGYYLTAHDLWNMPCRFDLICVEEFSDGQSLLEHYSNVIELRQVVDSGDAAWQPW